MENAVRRADWLMYGTLLPMVQEEFVKFYMPLLAKAYLEAGVRIDPKEFIGAVWKGYEANYVECRKITE